MGGYKGGGGMEWYYRFYNSNRMDGGSRNAKACADIVEGGKGKKKDEWVGPNFKGKNEKICRKLGGGNDAPSSLEHEPDYLSFEEFKKNEQRENAKNYNLSITPL